MIEARGEGEPSFFCFFFEGGCFLKRILANIHVH